MTVVYALGQTVGGIPVPEASIRSRLLSMHSDIVVANLRSTRKRLTRRKSRGEVLHCLIRQCFTVSTAIEYDFA